MNSAETHQNKDTEIAQLKAQVVVLTQQLDWFKQQLFGCRSEKQVEENPLQSPLFQTAVPANTETATQTVKAHKRKS